MNSEEKKEDMPVEHKARMDSLKALRKMAMEMIAGDEDAGLGDEDSPDLSVMMIKKKKGVLRPDMDDEEAEAAMGPEELEDYADDMSTDEEYDDGMSDEMEYAEEDEESMEKKLKKLLKA